MTTSMESRTNSRREPQELQEPQEPQEPAGRGYPTDRGMGQKDRIEFCSRTDRIDSLDEKKERSGSGRDQNECGDNQSSCISETIGCDLRSGNAMERTRTASSSKGNQSGPQHGRHQELPTSPNDAAVPCMSRPAAGLCVDGLA